MKKMIVGLMVALLMCVGLTSAHAYDPERGADAEGTGCTGYTDPTAGKSTGFRSSIYMVGDSITCIGVKQLRANGISWEVDPSIGRDVDTLPNHIDERLRNPSQLNVVVIALGTNAVESWTYDDLSNVVKSLPRATKVVFINHKRDEAKEAANGYNPDLYRYSDEVMYKYSTWENNIRGLRSGTCIFNWRYEAEQRPWRLYDGVHPDTEMAKLWANKLEDTVRACNAG